MNRVKTFAVNWWPAMLAIAALIAAVVAFLAWDEDDVTLKALILGVGVGLPAIYGAYKTGEQVDRLQRVRGASADTWGSSGICRVARRSDLNAARPLDKLIDRANSELLASGVTLAQFRNHPDLIEKKLDEGCAFRLLLPDPSDKTLMDKLAGLFEWEAQIGHDMVTSLQSFKSIWERAKARERFKVGLHSRHLTCSFVIVDNQISIVDFYAHDTSPPNRLAMELTKGEVLSHYRHLFDWMWDPEKEISSIGAFDAAIRNARLLAMS